MYNYSLVIGLFHVINLTSLLLASLLFWMYRAMKQNILVQSASITCMGISVLLVPAMFYNGSLHLVHETFCWIQAVTLNYCFVSLHAHFCFLMLRNLVGVQGWRVFGIRDVNTLTGLMVVLSLVLPVVPSLIVLAGLILPEPPVVTGRIRPPSSRATAASPLLLSSQIAPRGLFCVVSEPAWLGYRAWFVLFSAPGILCACWLLVRILSSRKESLKARSTTQYGWAQLARLLGAIVIYLLMAGASVLVGLSAGDEPFQLPPQPDLLGNTLSSSGSSSSIFSLSSGNINSASISRAFKKGSIRSLLSFCEDCRVRNLWAEQAACRVLCPAFWTFLPCMAGVALFVIYGMGSVAHRFYATRWGVSSRSGSGRRLLGSQSSFSSCQSHSTGGSGASFSRGRYQRLSHQRRTSALGDEFVLSDLNGSWSAEDVRIEAVEHSGQADAAAANSQAAAAAFVAARLQLRRGSEPLRSERGKLVAGDCSPSIPEEEEVVVGDDGHFD